MTMRNETDDGLEGLFAEARTLRAQPSEALMARVLADALAEQPRPAAPVVTPPAIRAGLWSRAVSLLGGAGALAGMGTAALAGLLIGYVQPAGLVLLGDAVLGAPLETVELIPSVETLFAGE